MSFKKKFSNRGLGLRVELIGTALFSMHKVLGSISGLIPSTASTKKERLSLQQLKGWLQKFIMIWEILYNAK